MNLLKTRGFTWIDVILSLAIVATLCQFVAPFSLHFYQRHRLATIADSLAQSIAFARNRALVTGHLVLLAPLKDTWSKGVAIHEDSLAGKPLRQSQWLLNGLSVTWHGFQSRESIAFSQDLSQSTANGHFCLCMKGLTCEGIVVNRLGHISRASASPNRFQC